MTQDTETETETERAEFERELIDNHHYVPSDFSFKDGVYGGDDDYIQFGWDLWQAARRAPVVPVDEAVRDAMHLIDDWSEKDFVAAEARLDPWSEHDPSAPMQMLEKLDKEAYAARLAIEQKLRVLLAAAPQPPELDIGNPISNEDQQVAAPVELPEPAAWTLQRELDAKLTTTNGHLWFSNPQNSLWTALYTEQQVRALPEKRAA